MKKIAFIPIDNRPVCYTLAEQIAGIDSDLKLLLPDRCLLGDLTKQADIEALFDWLESVSNVDAIILPLDTLAYGGLIPSRRSTDTYEKISTRLEKLKSILKYKNAKIYAFSSIMRISNNNINEEEKEYWNIYGEKLFKYSFETHKNGVSQTDVPQEIIDDYLSTRKRNFDINSLYLEWVQEGFFERLVFSKDDCSEYGLNVQEAQKLEQKINENKLNALVKTGADEIPLSLLSAAIISMSGKKITIAPLFLNPDSVDLISKYEDVSVYDSVKGQIELAGAEYSDDTDSADILLIVNNFDKEQGELVMGIDTEGYYGEFAAPDSPYIIADILNANGADNYFVKEILENVPDDNFLGYAGWNTTGNTLGSALCCGIIKYLAQNCDSDKFKKVQTVRFLDDWAYQANVRKFLKENYKEPDISALENEMWEYEKRIQKYLQTEVYTIKYSYPWNRFFEIEIIITNC